MSNDYYSTEILGFKSNDTVADTAKISVYYIIRLLSRTTQTSETLLSVLLGEQDVDSRLYDGDGDSVTLQAGSATFEGMAEPL